MNSTTYKKTIFIIDKREDIHQQINRALEERPYQVVTFVSGKEALYAVYHMQPDLIICGMETEDLDGKTLFYQITTDPAFKDFQHTPFLLFSDAEARSRYPKEFYDLGLRGWFTYPFGDHEIQELIENTIHSHEVLLQKQELEQEVRRSEYRYRDLLENANDFLFTLEDNGHFSYLNNRFTPLTGFEKEGWLGKDFLALIHPDDRDKALQHYQMAHHGRARIFEARILAHNKRTPTLSFSITPIFKHGKIVGSMGIGRDETEQKKMEKEILELKNFNESIIQSMEAGLLTVDLEGRITSLNTGAEKILECQSSQVCGKYLTSVLAAEEAKTLISDPPVPGSRRFSRETTLTVQSGRKINIGFTTTDRIDNQGYKVGTIVSFRDITELKQMQSEVIRMDRLASLGVLASGIAHEIKNPLAGIKTMAQACEEEFNGTDPRKEYLTRIIRQVNRLDDLLKTFFAFARPRPPNRKQHTLNEIVHEVLNLVQKKMSTSGIRYHEDIPAELPSVMVDGQQIQQVLLNLILNAIDAMPRGGRLELAARVPDDGQRDQIHAALSQKDKNIVQIFIRDSGTGIPEDKLENIFDPFFTTKSHGMGLGLSIVHRIILEHQGDIRVESEVENGTTFTITLPSGEGV